MAKRGKIVLKWREIAEVFCLRLFFVHFRDGARSKNGANQNAVFGIILDYFSLIFSNLQHILQFVL